MCDSSPWCAHEAARPCWDHLCKYWIHALSASQTKRQASHDFNIAPCKAPYFFVLSMDHSEMSPESSLTVHCKPRSLQHADSKVRKCDASWQSKFYSEQQFASNLQPLQKSYFSEALVEKPRNPSTSAGMFQEVYVRAEVCWQDCTCKLVFSTDHNVRIPNIITEPLA